MANHHDGGAQQGDSGADAGSGGPAQQAGSGGSSGPQGGAGGGSAHGGSGGSHGGAGGSDEPADTSALHIDSFAPSGAEVGGVFRYRVVLDQTGPASYELTESPDGASIDSNGLITWTPGINQAGQAHTFSVKASLGDADVTQDFDVSVTALVLSAEELLDPDSEELQIVSVSSPLSAAAGVSLSVPPGALNGAASLSISTTSGAPLLPAQTSNGDAPLVLGFGPSGSVFNSPIDLVIPLSSATWQRLKSGEGVASAWTLGSDGVWQSLPIEYVDLENGYVQIKLQHFSLVGLMASPALLTLAGAERGGSTCTRGVFVNAGFTDEVLATGLDQWLNGTAYGMAGLAPDSKLKQVLGMLPTGHSLQLRLRAVLTDAGGLSRARQYQVFSMLKRANGNIDLTVASDGGNVLYSLSDISPDSMQIDAALRGDFTHFVFYDYPAMQDGQIALDAFAYLRWPDAPPIVAGSEGQAFATLVEPFAYSNLSSASNDDDCDGIVNSADTVQTMALPPRIQSSSATTLRTTVNTALSLFVNVASDAAGGVSVTWTGSSPAAMIAPAADGLQASFVSAMPGSYKVTATAKDAAGSTSQSFLVIVDSPVTPNTPPRCKINAKRTSVFTGEQIPLEALLEDAEQPNQELSVEWSVVAGATLSSSSERRVAFSAAAPAVYDVRCVARDGLSTGQPTTLSLTVFDRPQNSPPRLSFVAPTSATFQIGQGGVASQQIRVTASDVDNDAVSVEFTLLEGAATLSMAQSPAPAGGLTYAARTFETSVPGPYAVLVRAVDQNNATSDSVVVKLLVAQSVDGTDADRDGFPASVDCNDADPKIYPGAPEICGDAIDQNCNGSDKALADCDADRDGKTANDGDCDDNNPGVFPGARERCNWRDDNCNGAIDEGYVVGTTCSLGVGACAAAGTNVCSRDGAASVCTAKPTTPVLETCNGVDDNCNGTIDDVPATGTADVNNCGGCGSVCSGNAHQVAACAPNAAGTLGCVYTCSQGYSDLDRNPQNGCEYSCSNPTKESCNGSDDDCDGRVDEQSDSQFYPGPSGTLGVGECRGGLMTCKQGVLVQAIAPITPAAERCDMRDNNCNGKVDEGFNVGSSCDGPDSDLCLNGRFICGPEGNVVCGLEPVQSSRDICDGLDNDCNPKTADGSEDPGLNKACDERNPAFCEPGHAVCTSGRMLCSNDMRDATSCRVCECDTTAQCDTNGTGYYCPCDPQCTGPGTGCPCDVATGCDLVDGAEECGCDPECVGETACSCDLVDNKCDEIALGFVCACDGDCGATCGCDATAGTCDKTLNGDSCLCDRDCYPSCACDDRNPDTCAKDSSGNACQCDPSCRQSSCACDVTVKACDRDTRTGAVCACDSDCGTSTCNCNTTSGCDKAASGDACLCDVDCSPPCPCDDRNPMTCARDSNGNACQCDPTCVGGGAMCECDVAAGSCDKDRTGSVCGCDKDCPPAVCECDKSSGACDKDAMGNLCACDRDCGGSTCTCDVTRSQCDKDAKGNPCACDRDCGSTCGCDTTRDQCDRDVMTGQLCGCDPLCGGTQCMCDLTKGVCDRDCGCDPDCQIACMCDVTRGACDQGCGCDRECQPSTCMCDVTRGACDKDCGCDPDCQVACMCDVTRGACDKDCGCDRECQPSTCVCDTLRGSCEKDSTGQICGCDADCGALPCDCDVTKGVCDKNSAGAVCSCDIDCRVQCPCDAMPNTCDKGPNGEICDCDPACRQVVCMCDLTGGTCDNDANGQACQCDRDCATNTCACDTNPDVCDKNKAGDSCLCDQRCYSACPCADNDPKVCVKDSEGNACRCDPGCEAAVPPGCACDKGPGTCDTDPVKQGPCACDVDCGAQPPACSCDSTQNCDAASGGDLCLCDTSCYPGCACDDGNAMTCAQDSAGNACRCDPTCQGGPAPSCDCDISTGACDKDGMGNPCACDRDCGAMPCACDTTRDLCDKDLNGQNCACDPQCGGMQCVCDVTRGACDKDCGCDKECQPSTCVCDVTRGACDKDCGCDPDCQVACVCDVTRGACDKDCGCDKECQPSTCMCDATRGSCDKDPNGQVCGCDADCGALPCDCDMTKGVCDKSQAGETCGCDVDCRNVQCPCDVMPNACDKGPNGQICDCDAACRPAVCACDVTGGACDRDPNGQPCMCDQDCSTSSCACDTNPDACDKNPSGDNCLCDSRCYPACPCADDDPKLCHKDSDGNACSCDPGCETAVPPGCACDKGKGSCDIDPMTQTECVCDMDCGGQPRACSCDITQKCDVASGGDPCLCDVSCYPACSCDDGNPMTCAVDSAGNACRCDPSCQGAGGPSPSCDCDVSKGVCDNSCVCDVDCPPSACMCDMTKGVCDQVNGQSCDCDADCGMSSCLCDVNPDLCDKDQAGQICKCDLRC